MKVVINTCYGGFHLSQEAMAFLGTNDPHDHDRTDSRLIEFIEKFGDKVNGQDYSCLEIEEIPDNSYFIIHDNDGAETIHYVDSRHICKSPARKVVINACYGGFELSQEAIEFLDGRDERNYRCYANREDARLVECVETLGDRASGEYAQLRVVKIPKNTHYVIDSYDGLETLYFLDKAHSYKAPQQRERKKSSFASFITKLFG